MATSERGGKDSSGVYIVRKDGQGNILTDQVGNPLIDQDCVKYRERDEDSIAEAFLSFAEKHRLDFWREG